MNSNSSTTRARGSQLFQTELQRHKLEAHRLRTEFAQDLMMKVFIDFDLLVRRIAWGVISAARRPSRVSPAAVPSRDTAIRS